MPETHDPHQRPRLAVLLRLVAGGLSPRPRPAFVAAYAFAIITGGGFLIGSSPSVSELLDPPFLIGWHTLTILGGLIAITGVWRHAARIEIAGLWGFGAALFVYAMVLVASATTSSSEWTLVGLAGLTLYAAAMTAARIGALTELLRTAARIDRHLGQ